MQPTHTMRKTRARSDPGSHAFSQEDMELKPASSQPEINIRNAVAGTTAPNPQEIDVAPLTEPLQTVTTPDSRAPRPTNITTILEQDVLVRATTGASASARPSAEEAAIPGQEKTLTRVIPESQPTVASLQLDNCAPTQGTEPPEPESVAGPSTGVTSMKSLTELRLPYIELDFTSDQGYSTGTSSVTPSLDHSAEFPVLPSPPQDAPSGRADSAGDILPVATLTSEHRNDAPDLESLVAKCRSMVITSELDDFRSILGRERNFRASIFPNKAKDDKFQGPVESKWHPPMAKGLREWGRATLLIEDADIECILALDAEFNLDPQFIVSYVGHPCFSDEWNAQFYRAGADTSTAGSWYVNWGTTEAAFSWRGDHPPGTTRRRFPKFFDSGEATATNAKRPWWREAPRQMLHYNKIDCEVKSRIACYRLSDGISLLLVESTPQLSSRIARPFDLEMEFRAYPDCTVPLPVSLKDLETGHPFAVFDCFRSLLSRRGTWLETDALRELTLFTDEKSSSEFAILRKLNFSTWILVACQWQENLSYLKDTFKRRRFVALAQPGMRTYLPLIDLRQKIVGMRDHLPRAQTESDALDRKMEQDWALHLSRHPSSLSETLAPSLSETLARIAEEIEKLDKELNDEIHLIIGAVTVQDSDANKTQTERATLLTLLAAVYLPLTLVTGIFGMNIKEISDGSPTWRHCGEVLAVTAACTVVFVLAYRQWRVWRRAQQEKEHSEFAFDKEV